MKKLILSALFLLTLSSFTGDHIKKKSSELTKESLWKELLEQNVQYPEIVFAQAMLESGNLKSTLCVKYNNLFGMKMPKKRLTLAKSTTASGFASFKTWEDAVADYKLYQEAINISKYNTAQSYLSHLNKRYSTTVSYSSKVKAIIAKNKSTLDCRVVKLEADTSARLADTEHEIGKK